MVYSGVLFHHYPLRSPAGGELHALDRCFEPG